MVGWRYKKVEKEKRGIIKIGSIGGLKKDGYSVGKET